MLGKQVAELDFAERIVMCNVGLIDRLFGDGKTMLDGVNDHVQGGRIGYIIVLFAKSMSSHLKDNASPIRSPVLRMRR